MQHCDVVAFELRCFPPGAASATTSRELMVVGSGNGGPRGQVRPGATAERLLNGSPSAIALVPAGWAPRDVERVARERCRLEMLAGRISHGEVDDLAARLPAALAYDVRAGGEDAV